MSGRNSEETSSVSPVEEASSDPPDGQTSADPPDGQTSADPPDGQTSADPPVDRGRGPIDRWEQLTLVRVVVGITAAALLARFVFLGARPAHWDEARVAYWASYYADTGSLGYHWEEHGPFLQIAARWLFEPLGVTDTAARLPVAIVGGLLPLSALLYREHLRASETVALALFLGGNSVLLYYSRFMRSDVLVAAFAFTALGLLVRFVDTRRVRYLYGAGVFLALGFGSKENAIVYVVTWVGAAALLTDQWLHSPATDVSGIDRLQSRVGSLRERLQRVGPVVGHALGAIAVFLGAIAFLFADRGQGVDGRRPGVEPDAGHTDLAGAIGDPLGLPGFALETLSATREGFGDWFGKSSETTVDTYVDFLDGYLSLLSSNATMLFAFAILGFVIERYARDEARPLVLFFGYCGIASLVGYPLGSDIAGDWAWISTHVVVPLAVPAAVGVAWFYRAGLAARADRDTAVAAIVALVLVVGAFQAGLTAATDVYRQPQAEDNELVQFAQPHDDLDPIVDELSTIAAETGGTDAVLYYGEDGEAYDSNVALVKKPETPAFWDVRPTCSDWSTTQPLNWYFAATDATVTCERSADALVDAIESDPPPMILTAPDDSTIPTEVIQASYDAESYYLRTIGLEITVYTHNSRN